MDKSIGQSFTACMKDFFGYNGGTLSSFREELSALTDKDKQDFREMLIGAGYNVIDK